MNVPQGCSESITEIIKKLFEIQKNVDGVHKSVINGFFKSKYADLKSVYDVIRKECNDNGILIQQGTHYYSGENVWSVPVATTLIDVDSGEWMQFLFTVTPEKQTPQGQGACYTYGKRYSLLGIFCIPTLDDDAESAMDRKPADKGSRTTPQKNIKYISKDQATALRDIANNNKMGKEQAKKIVHDFGHGAELYTKIPQGDYDQVAAHLEHEDLWET